MITKSKTFALIFTLLIPLISARAESFSANTSAFSDLKFGGVYYLSYYMGKLPGEGDVSQFSVKRAYLTVQKKFNPLLSTRVTIDAYQDITGDLKARMKYMYASFNLNRAFFLTNLSLEFGLVHTPWLDFEEHINYYRMQDTMYMERIGVINSGDFGLTISGYLNGKLNKDYQRRVNSKYCGRYGSFAFGVYNGGGYHAQEANENKVFQGRITIRPLPEFIPGLQLSYFHINGKVNKDDNYGDAPIWIAHDLMLSMEHQYFTFAAQYVNGKGNKSGWWVNWDAFAFNAWDYYGCSIFSEIKAGKNLRLLGRYDYIDPGLDELPKEFSRYIGGIGWDLGNRNIILIDKDWVEYDAVGFGDFERYQLTLQVHF